MQPESAREASTIARHADCWEMNGRRSDIA